MPYALCPSFVLRPLPLGDSVTNPSTTESTTLFWLENAVKITRVETMSVVVPVREGAWHSAEYVPEGYTYGGAWIRLHWPEFPIVLLKLHTDEGLVGLGEVPKGISEADVQRPAQFFEGRDLWSFNLQELPLETMLVRSFLDLLPATKWRSST